MNDGHPTTSPLTPKAIAARMGIQLLDELAAGDLATGDWIIVHDTDAGVRKKYDPAGLLTKYNLVTAASAFANDNRLLRSDGTGRGAQASGITIDDSDNVTIPGNLTVQGTTVTFDTETITVEDPLISLAKANAGDLVDIGVFGLYNDGSARYAGLFRDATDGAFRLFKNLTVAPTTTIDTSDGSFQLADLRIGTAHMTSWYSGNLISIGTRIENFTDDSDTAGVALNYNGYNGGVTRYRDFTVYDGKTNALLIIDGSAGSLIMAGTDPGSVSAGQAALGGGVVRAYGVFYSESGSVHRFGNINIRDDSIERHSTDSDSVGISFNYTGYNSGSTRFRDLTVYNGKGGLVLFVDGSEKEIKLYGTTDATTKDNGALASEGGISAEKNIHAGGDLRCDGVLKIDGTQVVKEQQAAIDPGAYNFSFTATSGGYGCSSSAEWDNLMSYIDGLQDIINDLISLVEAHGLAATHT